MLIKKNHLIYSLLAGAGAFSVLAFAPFNHGLCLIISLLSLLFFIDTSHPSKLSLAVGGYCYGFGFFVAQLYWFFSSIYIVIGAPLLIAIIAIIICNAYLALYILLTVWLYRKLITPSSEFNYLFLFPSLWVIGEWMRGWVLTGFSWCDVSYTQVNNYLMQGFFPVFGSYGVSWLTLSIIGGLFLLIKNRQLISRADKSAVSLQLRLLIIYLAGLAIAAYLLHGKQYTKEYGKATSVALVQGNITQTQKWNSKGILTTLGIYATLIAKAKADIILLPETAFVVYANFLPAHYLADIKSFAESNHAQLVIGMPQLIDSHGNYVNAAVVVSDPKSSYYAKSHLVPYGEYTPYAKILHKFYSLMQLPMVGFSSGSPDQRPLVIANQKVAFNICYENGFGSELIKAAREATVMINLSDMVWYGNTIAKDLHLQLSQARAMENQRYFIQETNTGISAIIDPDGRVVSRLPAFKRDILIDYFHGRIGTTPYQKYANYPILSLCCLLLVVALLLNFHRRRHPR